MRAKSYTTLAGLVAAATVALAGCAGTPGLTTASVTKPAPQPAVDPACAVLKSRITELSGADSTISRLEKAADGSTKSVMVKRSALAAAAELNRLNADYRGRCSNPVLAKAAVKPVAAAANATAQNATRTAATTAANAATAKATTAAAKAN
jgi:hypothetical protein